MNPYGQEIKKFISSQYLYAGTRIALSIVLPSILLAYFGLLKEYFLFPLATSFVGLTDQVGPFIRRRNALLLAVLSLTFVAWIGMLLAPYPVAALLTLIVFGLFFSMIGVYGQRLMAVGGLTLVVYSIFIDGHLTQGPVAKNILVYALGSLWYLLVFLVFSKLQPYKLASQMIGENYLELGEYLKLKAQFYQLSVDYESTYSLIIAKQINIKNLQQDTREVVFKTRTLVSESTTTSRLLMLLFLNSIDLYEKLFTSDQNYRKLHSAFDKHHILEEISSYLQLLSTELIGIGISLQASAKPRPQKDYKEAHRKLYHTFFELRKNHLSAQTLEDFMALRLVLSRISSVTEDISTIYKVGTQDIRMAKSLSSGLDLNLFVPKEEKLSTKVFRDNLSLKSYHFRHAVRIVTALSIGYLLSLVPYFSIGHSYWILITILAIMRPAYSTTKHRNLLRLYGTLGGAVVAYWILKSTSHPTVLLSILLGSMIFCFTLLKGKYAWAVFFMTIYIFIGFNFLNPGNINALFRDRLIDTAIAGVIVYAVSYFVLPVWEHSQNPLLMRKSLQANTDYLMLVCKRLQGENIDNQNYKLARKEAVIALANLSDNFQRMLSDPKNQQRRLEIVHQFVNTSHLVTAYSASLAQYASDGKYPELSVANWQKKILSHLETSKALLENRPTTSMHNDTDNFISSAVEELLEERKEQLTEEQFLDHRDPTLVPRLTELKNIYDIMELLLDVVREQRKVLETFHKEI